MEVTIGELESTVTTYDAEAMLTPRTLAAIVAAVLDAINDRDEHRERLATETNVSNSVVL